MLNLILQNLDCIAKFRIRRLPHADISALAKVHYRKINIHANSPLTIGQGSIIESSIITDREGASISIGKNTFIGASTIIGAEKIEIGDDVLIAWGCFIVDHNSHSISWSKRQNDVINWMQGMKNWDNVATAPIKINNRSWIGFNSLILKGVIIGEGSVVGAGSVVTKDVPPYTIVAGNPAKIIREITIEER
jgi:acetyltransferase-like isoleucine patch superfamily enzyme